MYGNKLKLREIEGNPWKKIKIYGSRWK